MLRQSGLCAEVVDVLVIGASGFLGAACVSALRSGGLSVTSATAPRLRTPARSLEDLLLEVSTREEELAELTRAANKHEIVVNCAGIAAANAAPTDELYGANALVPALISQACRLSGIPRFIQVSSAAVQGRMDPLRETPQTSPFSPYSDSKALGEAVSRRLAPSGLIIFRPTSVHGPGRPVTTALCRLARSPLSSVAGAGDRPTPQVLIDNVAAAVAFLSIYDGTVPLVVLQPSEGLTTSAILRILGVRAPLRIPIRLARSIVLLGYRGAHALRRGDGLIRRVELLWLGQGQQESWLVNAGYRPPAGLEAWCDLARKASRHAA